jgi:hypothetical protein
MVTSFFDILETRLPVTYSAFKDSMQRIHSVKQFAAPYSIYLYGKSMPIPEADMDIVKRMAPYAAGLARVLPASSLLMSASLTKLAQQASVNALSSDILVDAFVSAFRQNGRRLVERSFNQGYKIQYPRVEQ